MQDVINKLRTAKMAHKRWVSHASALIEGIPIEKGQVPINYTECIFGTWYYGEGQDLRHLKEFNDIEEPHTKLHLVYMEIFNILFTKKKLSLFSKLIGKSTSLNEEDRHIARVKFKTLEHISKQIVERLNALEDKIKISRSN